ncbi:MAG: YVTN family beta-propeller protein, partial [Planctomycetota bacterium]
PRSLAFTPDGATLFVSNQRGNVEVTKHFVSPFDGTERRGTVSVIDTASRSLIATLDDVGTEPYGLVVAPNGLWFAVTGFRSNTVRFYTAAAPYAELVRFAYDADPNFIAPGLTVADIDRNGDLVPDLAEPRAITIQSDGLRAYVTHTTSGFVSALDLTLDGGGLPTSAALAVVIDLNDYGLHPTGNPIPVQDLASRGLPRFLDDIALSPDGLHALVPHVLHNVNHDVNHDFGPDLAGDFANRVYPALTVIDTSSDSYGQLGDSSARLHNELGAPDFPASHVPYGGQGFDLGNGRITLGGIGAPIIGGTANYTVSGSTPGDMVVVFWSTTQLSIPAGVFGTLLTQPESISVAVGGMHAESIPNNPALDGISAYFQAAVFNGSAQLVGLSNGIETVLGFEGAGLGRMGHRAGHPGRVLYSPDGDHALMLNRGSEDVFLYDVAGSDLELRSVFPPRQGFVERSALDLSTPLGDMPLGMTLVDDAVTLNDDAQLYVLNEGSRTVSSLRVDWTTGVISREGAQIPTLLGSDEMTPLQQLGQEIFEDASRSQTTGNFNNSCGSCHFEGGADGNVWQRPAGPRSTMPVYGGSLLTGMMLWKGVRLNMGETGPMFGGENGGHGILTDNEQQSLIEYHKVIPVPLNPNLDPFTGDYSANAALGKDLFFGLNDTGMNPTLRIAGCATCHPDSDSMTGDIRGYTADFVNELLTDNDMLESLDPGCFSLRQSFVALNLRDINSGANIDGDGDGFPDGDRNFDGFDDRESYAVMNVDDHDDFSRDDPNSYDCPNVPGDPSMGLQLFLRDQSDFSVPTKLGSYSTGPYMHDHSVLSLRGILDPQSQMTDPVYGSASLPMVNKFKNEFHDVRGDDTFFPNSSKVQLTLQTIANGRTFDEDIRDLLEYIRSL